VNEDDYYYYLFLFLIFVAQDLCPGISKITERASSWSNH